MSANEIQDELNMPCGVHTVRKKLREHNFFTRSPRKVPFLEKHPIERRLEFAPKHFTWPLEKWKNILWTEELKVVLYGGKGLVSMLDAYLRQNTTLGSPKKH